MFHRPIPSASYNVITATRRREVSPLRFSPVTEADIPVIMPYLAAARSRTCDFSIGGLLMWADYFDYAYAIYNDTLFIKGVTEDDVTRPAFSLPVGKMSLRESVGLLKDYCRIHGLGDVQFSAVPEEAVAELKEIGVEAIEPLVDWGDYVYEAEALATLTGKKLSKKRNHVNRFMADNPGAELVELTPERIQDVKGFLRTMPVPPEKPALADIEREQVFNVLDHYACYPFEGAVLRLPERGIVAFAIGEVIGDTLFTHIEKMDHTVAGAGETINKLFASYMLGRHPGLRYINREEAVGDPGLVKAKESYHPAMILAKYNVRMQ